jgi:GNAT superfamily N-acetyltransferase
MSRLSEELRSRLELFLRRASPDKELNTSIKPTAGSHHMPSPMPVFRPLPASRSDNDEVFVESVSEACCVVIEQPKLLPIEAQHALFSILLPYTSEAFGETMDSITEESKQEHFEHVVNGDVLLLCGLVEPALHDFRFVAHTLVQTYRVELPGETESSTIAHISGTCCDPLAQRRGIASFLLNQAIAATRSRFVTARTQNTTVVKMMASVPNSTLWPGQAAAEKKLVVENSVIINVANHIANAYGQDAACYDPEKLVFRRVYAADRVQTFSGSPLNEAQQLSLSWVDTWLDRAAGDAVLLVLELPSQ